MKNTLLSAASFLMSASVMADNPIFQTDFTADPAPVVIGDTVFVFTSHDEDGVDYFTMNEWRVFSTVDMVNWTDRGAPIQNSDFKWADRDAAWASQMIERDGKYYFYVTSTSNGPRVIGVGVADHPAGPYKDAIGKPLAGPNWNYIDPTVFIDDNGQAYAYWGNPKLYWCKLNKDMVTIDGRINETNLTAESNYKYTEGPWISKRNGIYYMIYASHGVPEKISYATSNSPEGPWTSRGIIQESGRHNEVNNFAFTIHSGVIDFKGHSYYFYHNQNLRGEEGYTGGFTRSCCVEEFTYGADGSIPLIPATNIGVKNAVKNLDPYLRVEAETKAFSHGLRMNYKDRNNIFVHGIDNGDYIKVRSVDFGEEGAFKFVAAVRCASGKGGNIEVHLDKKDGEKIASLSVEPTNNAWKELETEVMMVTGVHDIYFTFSGQNSEMFEFDYWYFVDQSHNIPQTPYNGEPAEIPGKIQAEEYDLGGSGKAYYDMDGQNRGEAFRKDGVDVYKSDEIDGFAVGYAQKGEWLEYSVNVKVADDYKIRTRLSTGNANAGIKLYLDDEEISDFIQTAENDGDWEAYLIAETMTKKKLPEGEHILKLQIEGDWINVDWIEFCDKNSTNVVEINNLTILDGDYTVYTADGKIADIITLNNSVSPKELLKNKGFEKGVYLLKSIDDKDAVSVIVE